MRSTNLFLKLSMAFMSEVREFNHQFNIKCMSFEEKSIFSSTIIQTLHSGIVLIKFNTRLKCRLYLVLLQFSWQVSIGIHSGSTWSRYLDIMTLIQKFGSVRCFCTILEFLVTAHQSSSSVVLQVTLCSLHATYPICTEEQIQNHKSSANQCLNQPNNSLISKILSTFKSFCNCPEEIRFSITFS